MPLLLSLSLLELKRKEHDDDEEEGPLFPFGGFHDDEGFLFAAAAAVAAALPPLFPLLQPLPPHAAIAVVYVYTSSSLAASGCPGKGSERSQSKSSAALSTRFWVELGAPLASGEQNLPPLLLLPLPPLLENLSSFSRAASALESILDRSAATTGGPGVVGGKKRSVETREATVTGGGRGGGGGGGARRKGGKREDASGGLPLPRPPPLWAKLLGTLGCRNCCCCCCCCCGASR